MLHPIPIALLGDAMSSARIGEVMSGVSTPIGTQSSVAMDSFSETLTKLLTQKALDSDAPRSLGGSRVPSRAGTGSNTPTALQTMLAVQRFNGFCSGASTPVANTAATASQLVMSNAALVMSSSSYAPPPEPTERSSISGAASASTKSNGSSLHGNSSVRSFGSANGLMEGIAGYGSQSVSPTLGISEPITVTGNTLIGYNKSEQPIVNGVITQASLPIYDRFTPMEALQEKSSHSTPIEQDMASGKSRTPTTQECPLPLYPTLMTSQSFGSALPQLQRSAAFYPPPAPSSSGYGTLLKPSYYGMDPSSILARSSGTHTPNAQVQGFMNTMMGNPAIANSNSMAHLVRKGTEMLAKASQINAKRLMTLHFGPLNRIIKIVVVDQ